MRVASSSDTQSANSERSKTPVRQPDPIQSSDRCGKERNPGTRKHALLPMNGIQILPCLLCILLPVLATTTEPQCTLMELHRCLQSLQTQSNDLAFAATRYELLALCSGAAATPHREGDLHRRLTLMNNKEVVSNHN
ncbi:hypothetical protein NPIL_237051 [Nephila pilipes]|uniref:Uncharacterized protein n=1 Tax=Nephila pilipes TaxID=299642 RepID=A0A8X6Q068_NEPPI|nr:hypothetical protein NPIL_237051 [Nephila pilipes]